MNKKRSKEKFSLCLLFIAFCFKYKEIFFIFALLPFDVGLFLSGQCPYLVKNNLDIPPFHSQLENRVKRPQRWGGICLRANRAGNCQIFLPESCCPPLIKVNFLMCRAITWLWRGHSGVTHIPFPQFLRLGIKRIKYWDISVRVS